MDRRVKYTRMVLNDSLLKFLEKKPVTKITVTEICEDADVNRSTYYAHFTDPMNQLNTLKKEIYRDVEEFTKKLEVDKLPAGKRQLEVFSSLLQYVEKKRRIFQILLTKSGDHNVQHDLLAYLGTVAFPKETDPNVTDLEKKYKLLYASNGCFGMLFQWLTDSEPVSPEQMAKIMADFTKDIRI